MTRGRPKYKKHIKNNDETNTIIDTDKDDATLNIRQKRKYVKKGQKDPKEINKTCDNIEIKQEGKRRGRKRGRKKKDSEFMFKPEFIMDYVIRNFPKMDMDKIKDKVISGLMLMKKYDSNPYLLTKISYDGNIYYKDDRHTVFNPDGQIIGYLIKQDDNSNKLYLINDTTIDTRSYEEIMDFIMNKNNV